MWAAFALVGGCTHYRPSPLGESLHEALVPPSPEELQVAAAALDHPYLAPLTLDLDDGLTPDEAAVLAVLAQPDLAAMRAQRGLARAQLLAAGILPNPQLSLGASIARNDTTAVTGSSLGLGFDLAALVTRGARRESARLTAEQVDLEIAWREWQVAQAARLQTYRTFYLQEQLRLARRREETLRASYRVSEEAAARRLVTEVERAAAESSFNRARGLRMEAETQAERARLELLRIMGFPPDADFDVQVVAEPDQPAVPALEVAPEAWPGERLVADLERRRLDLAALRLGYESQEERVRAAVLSQFPAINVDLTRTEDTAGLVTLDPSVSIDFPIFDRNQGEIAVERAERESLGREYAARLFTARADVADLTAASRRVGAQLEQADAIVGAQERLVEVYARALRFGNADVLTFHEAELDLLASELERLALRQSLAELRVGLMTVLGGAPSERTNEIGEAP